MAQATIQTATMAAPVDRSVKPGLSGKTMATNLSTEMTVRVSTLDVMAVAKQQSILFGCKKAVVGSSLCVKRIISK